MWDQTHRSETCHVTSEPDELPQDNDLLREENTRLRQQAQDVAQANAHAAELMAQLEEVNESLKTEVDRRRQAEEELRRAYGEMEARVQTRTAELTTANEQLAKEIGERQRMEETLRENEQRLNTVLHDILTGVIIVDAETRKIKDANPHAAEIIGLPPDEIIGKVCHRFVCPAEEGKCPIADLGQTVDQSERVLLRADGREAPILKTVTSAVWQGHRYFIESFIDISGRKKTEEDLKESLSLLEATLESTADGILVVDHDGKIKSFNTQFRDIWRIPDNILESRDEDKALSFVLSQLKAPEQFLEKVKELYAQPEEASFDVIEFADGRVLERYSKPQMLSDQIVGRVWSFRDVTRAHNAQQKQEKLMRQVAAANEELSHFAYVVSHDLKAPLRGIKLLTEWLCDDYGDKLGEDAKEQLDLLQNRVGRMHNLIEGVLQYSRVGRIKEEVVDVDLNDLLSSITDTIAAPEHIRVTIQGPLPTVAVEKTRITQVFQNLLTNAVKYMDKPQGQITVACADEGDAWKFSVSDNGPGIEEKYFERIFRIFQTLVPRDEFESTGVGLTLVKKIVELYGGRVWVESVLGQGSSFLFTLSKQRPVVGDEPPTADAEDDLLLDVTNEP